MKKLLLILFFIPFILYSQTFVSTSPQNKKVVLEEYTGIHCVNCPGGHLIAKQIYDNNPGDAFIIAIHTGSFASPSLLEPDFRIDPIGSTLANTFGVSFNPSATINRHLFSGNNSLSMSPSNWATTSAQISTESSPVNVGVQAIVDSTNTLFVDVEVYYTGSQTVTSNKLNVAVVQNNVEGPQSGMSANPSAVLPNGNYNHQHMLRHLMTGQWGATISTITQGSLYTNQFTWSLPADINGVALDPMNLSVIAFISEDNDEILSGDESVVNYNNPSWDCVNNSCVFDNTGSGQFTTLYNCQNSCNQSWDCISNNCIDPGNNSGQYNMISSCLLNCASTNLSKTRVPDSTFENFLEFAGMGDGIIGNDSVLTCLIDTITELLIPNLGISDLTGIEDFILLEKLDCSSNNLIDTLDLSQNTFLTTLYCNSNQLTFLDISTNTTLTRLYCAANQLTSLDITSHTSLQWLVCQENNITLLDVTQNPMLYKLTASFNPLQSLDVSFNRLLNSLDADDIGISSLNLSNNLLLTRLSCWGNQLTNLDVSLNTSLVTLNCSNNDLTNLDIRNGNNINMVTNAGVLSCFTCFKLNNNPNLTCINVDDIAWADTNWTVQNGNIDSIHYFSTECQNTYDCVNNICILDTTGEPSGQYLTLVDCQNNCVSWDCDIITGCDINLLGNGQYTSLANCNAACNSTSIEDYNPISKELIRITNVLGQETQNIKHTPLFYIYDDGTVEKRIIIE